MIRLCVALVAAVMACGSAFAQGRLASPALNNPTLTGGTVDGAVIGGTTPAPGGFTNLSATGTVSGAGITTLLAPYAPLASPTFTGIPAGPTASGGTNTTQIATTAFTTSAVATETSRATAAEALLAPKASPTFTGTPAAPTVAATAASGTTQLATTAFVRNGTTTNDNALSGQIGEYISSSVALGSAVALTTSTNANITSISLTAGDWDVWGTVATNPAGSTVTSFLAGSISLASATQGSVTSGAFAQMVTTTAAGGSTVMPVGCTRISLAATTTVYLVTQSTFTVSTNAAYGFIGARRVR